METLLLDLIKGEITTYFFLGISFVMGMVAKELLTSFVYGIMFYFDKDFMPGDHVVVDGECCVITSIGLSKSVFRNVKTGNWRYVHNSKVRYLKLEKVIDPPDCPKLDRE